MWGETGGGETGRPVRRLLQMSWLWEKMPWRRVGVFAHPFSSKHLLSARQALEAMVRPQCWRCKGPVQLMCRGSEIQEAGMLPDWFCWLSLTHPRAGVSSTPLAISSQVPNSLRGWPYLMSGSRRWRYSRWELPSRPHRGADIVNVPLGSTTNWRLTRALSHLVTHQNKATPPSANQKLWKPSSKAIRAHHFVTEKDNTSQFGGRLNRKGNIPHKTSYWEITTLRFYKLRSPSTAFWPRIPMNCQQDNVVTLSELLWKCIKISMFELIQAIKMNTDCSVLDWEKQG